MLGKRAVSQTANALFQRNTPTMANAFFQRNTPTMADAFFQRNTPTMANAFFRKTPALLSSYKSGIELNTTKRPQRDNTISQPNPPADIRYDNMIDDVAIFFTNNNIPLIPVIDPDETVDGLVYSFKFLHDDWYSEPYTNQITIHPDTGEIHVDYLNMCRNIYDDSIISGKDIMNTIIKYAKENNYKLITLQDAANVKIIGCTDPDIVKDTNEISDYISKRVYEINDGMNVNFNAMMNIYRETFHRLSVLELVATNNTWYGKHFGFVEDVGDAIAEKNRNLREIFANQSAFYTVADVGNRESRDAMTNFINDLAIRKNVPRDEITMRDCALRFQEMFNDRIPLTPDYCKALAIFINSILMNTAIKYPKGVKFPYYPYLKLDISQEQKNGGRKRKRTNTRVCKRVTRHRKGDSRRRKTRRHRK